MSRTAWSATAVAIVVLVGCLGEDPNKPLPDPIPTNGPNQVVVFVPSMT